MFTLKDFLEYFGEILKIEKAMKLKGVALMKKVSNVEAESLLAELVADEERHAKIVKNIIKIIKKQSGTRIQ